LPRRKYRVVRRVTQPKILILGSRSLKQARKETAKLERQRKRRAEMSVSGRKRLDKQLRKSRKKELEAQLSALKDYGLYKPEGRRFTARRKKEITRKYNQLEELLKGGAFAKYPTKSRKKIKQIQKQARRIGAKVTRTGIIAGRDPREMQTHKGVLHFDKRFKLWRMRVKKEVITKEGKRLKFTEDRFIAGSEALFAVQKDIERAFERMPALKKNQRIRFLIDGPQGNKSNNVFSNLDQLFKYLEGYRKTPEAVAAFATSLTMYIVERPKYSKRRGPGAYTNFVDGFDMKDQSFVTEEHLYPDEGNE
jgi:hypothetical protein